jgi:glycosyltransferase involved in cell wall biosynthesis
VSAGSAENRRRRVVVIASLAKSLTNFRLELLKAMVARGHEVTALAPDHDSEVMTTLHQIGVSYIQVPMARASLTPLKDVRTIAALYWTLRELSPDLLLTYTMKPIIFGGLAARFAGVKRRFALITGLGYVFSDEATASVRLLVRRISVLLYRLALKGAECVFVYNDADEKDIRETRMLSNRSPIVRVPGSGVDTKYFDYSEPDAGIPTFLLIARLLREKGILEYAEALRELRREFREMRAVLAGPFDSNPSSIDRLQIDRWVDEGLFRYLGELKDVRPILARSSVFVLPTYYREGIPRTILEAMAVGRPIITTDLPGCRDTVIEGENGYLVKPRNAKSLAAAMERFLKDPTLARRFGKRSREIVCAKFDVHSVNRILLRHMDL